jgi:hypothetical protein
MPLEPITLPENPRPLPKSAELLIREGRHRIDQYFECGLNRRTPRFLPSDYDHAAETLQTIQTRRLAPGNRFCEWGSGFGIVAGLAAIFGFEACGIEIEPLLIQFARELAADFDLPVQFACRSFVPDGFEVYEDRIGESTQLFETARLPSAGRPARPAYRYEELELDIEDLDVVFAYPWPGEQQLVEDLFEATAVVGGVLVLYQGIEDLVVWQKAA